MAIRFACSNLGDTAICDLITALTIGSTVMGAAGQIQQGQAAKKAGEYNAKVAEMNATLSERRARDALERGAVEEQRKRQEVAQLKGRQIASMAANGVDVGYGSPLDSIVDTAVLGEMDALTIRSNAYRENYDFKVDAANGRASASMARAEGKNAASAGYLGAAGTVLTGGSKAYSSYKSSLVA